MKMIEKNKELETEETTRNKLAYARGKARILRPVEASLVSS
jgi:hypothetical protein